MIAGNHKQKYLYHYTNQTGLIGIVKNESIWATHVFFQNDGSEFIYGKSQFYKYIRDFFSDRFKNFTENTINQIEEYIKLFDNPMFTISFSEDKKSLNQFRSYSKSESGFSIGFDVNKIEESFNNTSFKCKLVKCIYSEKEQLDFINDVVNDCISEKKIKDVLDEDFVSFIAAKIVTNSPVIKHNSFSEEKEWRLIFDYLNPIRNHYEFRNGYSYIIPYLKIPIILNEVLGEVIVGPTPHSELSIISVKELLSNSGIFEGDLISKVYYSEIPYRNW